MSINISDPINFIIDDSIDIGLNQTQINNYLTPIYDTSTNPKFTWENNKNTGMYHPLLNTIAFSTNGNERLRLNASGNINFSGIITGDGSGLNQLNATNIRSGTLTVSQGGTGKNTLSGNQILIGNGTDPLIQSSYLTWDNPNNRLGIGITIPLAKLDISHNTTETVLKVNQLGTGNLVDLQVTNTSILKIDGNKNINMYNNLIYTNASTNRVGIGITEPTEKLHVLGNTRIQGNLEVNGTTSIINTNIANSEQLNITNDGTGPALTINQKGNEAIIEIKDDGDTCLKIFDGGNLGIGTATKIVTADISGNLNVSQTIKSTNVNTSSANVTTILNANMVDISNNSTNTALKVNQIGTGNLIDLQDNSVSKFKIDTSGNIFAGALYIDSSNNNVGIGTIQPDISGNTKLHVSGNVRIEGNLKVNGTLEQINTVQGTTEQLKITNDGTGPAVIINQTGAETILDIQDDSATCFKIRDGGHVDIGTSTKLVNVDISGNIKSSGTITSTSTISSTGNISSSAYVIATGAGAHAAFGNIKLGNAINWSGTSHPTIGSDGSTGSMIMIDNPHFSYRTDNIFLGRTFRAGFRCPTSSSYANYWDCGATGYGFEILNSSLNNASTSCMTINTSGNVGIGKTDPFGPLCVGNSSLNGSDGFIIIGKNNGAGGSRHLRIGYDTDFNFVIGDGGGGNISAWTSSFKLSYQAPANSLVINTLGHTTLRNILYVGNAEESSTIFLGGSTGDGEYNNSVIETRKYASVESTELLLFKGNDTASEANVGPDRIRLRAAAIAFDTYPSASSVRTSENIRMYIDQNGNVGINTVAPRAKLDIYDNSMVVRSTSQTGQSVIYLGTPFDASSAFKCAIIAEGIGSTSRSKLHFCLDDTSDNSVTYNASITNSRMTILRSGYIGIGNTNPQNILQIGNGGRLRISNDNTDYTLIGTIDTDTSLNSKIIISGNGRVANEGNVQYYSTNTGSHIWYTTNTNSERMRISSTGNVGLGVTDPQYKLDMIGDINVSGEIRIKGIPYINSVLVTPSYYSLFDRIPGPSTITSNYTFTSSNSFSVYRAGILNISYSGDVKSVNIGLINATINIINIETSVIIYTKVTSLLADQATKNYSLPSILDNIGLTYGTYYATITFNTNTQIDNNNFQTLKVLFFPDNNVSNGLYSYNTKISYIFHKLNGAYDLSPDGTQNYSTTMNNILGNVIISTGTTKINSYIIPKGYQIWTVGATGTYTIIAAGASGASYGSYAGGRGAVISTTYNLTVGDKIILAVGQKPKNQSSGGGGSFVTKYNGTGAFTTLTQHNIILVAGGGGGAGSGIVPGPSNVLDFLPGLDASFTTSGTRYNFKNSINSSSTIAIYGGAGGGNGLAGGNLQNPDGIDAVQTSSGSGGGGFTGTGGDVDSTCTGGRSFLNGGLPGQNTWGSNNTGAGFGGGGAGWYSGGGGGGYSGGQGANYNEQTGGGGGGSYDINTATNNGSPYTLWQATSSFPPSTYITSGYNSGDGFILIEYDNGQLLGSQSDTETNPFYSWSEDIDTGIYHPATNSIGLTTNGSEKLRVDPSGNVGIGKTNPIYKLDISGINGQDNVKMNGNIILSTDGSSNYIKCGGIMSNQNGTLTNFISVANSTGLCFVDNGSLALISNSSERMRIDNSGNVGINTTTPIYNLQIGDNANSNKIIATTNIHLTNNYFDSGAWGVRIAGFDNNLNGHDFKVLTRNAPYASFVESFTVTSSGNIGIGITNPSNILQIGNAGRLRIANNISDYTLLGTADQDGATNTRIVISGNTRSGLFGNIEYVATSSGTHIWITGSSNERMRLNSSGFLGIGTNTPNAPLQFGNIVSYRRLVLFELSNNDHQFVGFGSNGGLTFQNPNTSDSFQFRAGTSGSSSNELMRLTGNGQLLINTNAALNTIYKLQVENTSVFIGDSTVTGNNASGTNGYRIVFDNTYNVNAGSGTAANKIVLHSRAGLWLGGFGIESGSVTYHAGPTSGHTFYSGASGSVYGSLNMIITYDSKVGIGKRVPNVELDVVGGIAFTGIITGNGSGLNLLNATNIKSGILNVAQGGTGLSSLNANQLLFGNTTNPILQSINLSWDNATNTLSATNIAGSGAKLTSLNVSNVSDGILNVSRGGTGTTTLTSGQILVGNGSGTIIQSPNFTWDNSNNILSASKLIGSGTGLTAINAQNITIGVISVITGGTGLSTLSIGRLLIGNGTSPMIQSDNLTWNNTDNILTATNFSGSGTKLTAINASNLSDGVVNVIYGGTGKTSLNVNQLLIGNGTGTLIQSTNLSWDNSNNILNATNLTGSGSNLTNLNASKINLGTLPVTYGGTGLGTLATGKLLVGNGTNSLIQSNNLNWDNASNTLSATNFAGSGASITNLTAANITGNLNVSQGGTGKTSFNANQILIGNTTGALIQSTNLSWDNTNNILNATNFTGSGSNLNNLNASKINLGTLPVTYGGTGLGTLATGKLLVGNGTNSLIQSNNLNWDNASNTLSATNFAGSGASITALTAANITGNLSVSQGGTGKTSLNANQILIGNTTGALIQSPNLSWDNPSNTLTASNFTGSGSNLTNLNASKINLGTLPVAYGGTGLGTLVAGKLLVGNGTGIVIQSNNLNWDNASNTLSATNFAGSGTAITNLTATNITGNINVSQGGTGATTLALGKLLVGNGTGVLIQPSNLSWDNNNTLTAPNFAGSGTALTNLAATNITGNISVSQGGTGKTTLVAGNLLVGNGTDALIQSNNLTWTNNNTLSATNFAGSGTALTNLTAANITGNISVSQGGTGVTSSTGTGSVVLSNGATMINGIFSGTGSGLSALNATNISTGTLPVLRGGTGVTTLTGDGSLVLSNAATMTNGTFGGTGTGLSGLNALNISLGTLLVARGGTGTTTATGSGSVVLSNGATMINGTFSGTGTGLSALNATNINTGTLTVLQGGTGTNSSTGNGSLVLSNAATMTNSTFSGTGTGLSGLNATNISEGTLSILRGGSGTSSATGSGSLVLSNFATMTNGTFSGTGTGLSALNATNISEGTLSVLRGGTGTSSSTGNGSLVLSNAATMTNSTFSGIGTGLTGLNASNINSGTLAVLHGGTGLNTITNNKLLIGGLNNTIIQSNNLHWNNTSNRLGINVINPATELDISGNVTILGNVIPATNITYDLGSDTNRWRDLYLSGNTINMNGLLLSKNNDGNLKLIDSLGNTNKLILKELEFFDGIEKISLTKNTNGKMILVRKDLSNNILETLNISSSDLSTVNQLGIGIAVTQLNATLDILSTNNNNGLLINHTNASGNIINFQKNGTTKFKIDNSGNLFASNALFVDTSNNYVGISVTNPSFNLHVLGPARVEGDLIVNGTFTKVNTTIQDTDQLTITNNGTATTIIANQTGANSIVDFRSNGNTKFKIFSSGDVGIGQSSSNVNVDISGNLTVSGNMNASGSKLYNINATNINTGILSVAYGGTGVTSSTGYGSTVLNTSPIITDGIFSGNGTGLTALNGDNINIGKLSVLYGGTGASSSTGSGSVVLNTNPVITNGTFSGIGSGLSLLNAENISTGTLRISNGGTGCTSLNSSYFDTSGNILSLKSSILNLWTPTATGNNIYYNGNIAIGKTIASTTLGSATLDISGNIISSNTVKGNGLITTTNLSFENVAGTVGAGWQIDISNSVLNFKNNIGGTFNNKLTLTNTGDFNVTGIISGNGSGLSSLNASNIDRGILNVVQGGTGLSNISINKLLVGNGINQIMQPSNLHWDSGNNRLGIGTINPTETLHVSGSIIATNYKGSGSFLTSLNASNISDGTLAVSRGGIGTGTLNINQLLIGNASDALIQSANLTWDNTFSILNATNFAGSGSRLTSLNATNITDGTLSVSRGGIGTGTLVPGKLLVGNGTGTLLQPSNLNWDNASNTLSATNFVGSGTAITNLTATNILGNINVSQGGTGATTLVAGNLLVGNGTNALIQSNNLNWNNNILSATNFAGSGTAITNLTAANITGNISVSQGGTGKTTLVAGKLLVGNDTSALIQSNNLSWDNTNNILTATNFAGSGTAITNLTATNITGNISVSQGGTGATTLALGKLLVGNGTGVLIQPSNLSWDNNNTLTAPNFAGSGTAITNLTAANITGNISVSQGGTGKTSLNVNQILIGNATGALIQSTSLSWDNPSNTLTATNFAGSGTALTNLTATNITGNISVSQGGTGATTLALGKILVGNGTGVVIQPSNLSWDNSSNTLSATNFAGSGASLTSLSATNITGNLNVSQGGTGATTLALGKLLVGNGTNSLIQPTNLSWDNPSNTLTATNFIGSGTAITNLTAANITGNINVSQGGTGYNTLTAGQLLVGNGTNPMIQTPNLTWNTTSNRLGICTTTPIATLDVSGNVNILGIITGDGSSLRNLNSSNINTGTLSISCGGTGVSTFTSNQILIGNATNNLIQTPNLTWNNNSLGIRNPNPSEALDVSGNITSSGTVKGTNGLISNKDLLFNNIAGASWQIDISNYILNFKNDNGGVFNNKLSITNTGNLNVIGIISGDGSGLNLLNATNIKSGTLSVTNGGTGLTTLTNNKLLVGNGTGVINQPSNLHWDINNNRLGICTNNPNSTLDVTGNISASSNISTSGTFIGSGNTLTNLNTSNVSSGTLNALYGGTGCTSLNTLQFDTIDNILKIKDTISSKWTGSGTSIYYNTGNIGIGITNPFAKFDISHNSTSVALKVNQIGSGDLIDLQDNSISKFKIDTSGNITANILYVDASNNCIGIGTTQPSKQLHVVNESQFDNKMTINADISHNKRLTITNSITGPALLINQIGSHPIMELQNSGVTTLKILDTGDVAIGTSTKSINVDISGNIKASNVIRSNLFYVGNESSTYGILRVYNNNNDNCILFINDTLRTIEGGSKTATLRNDGGALRLQSISTKGLSIDISGNVNCDTFITITGAGSHTNWGNTKIGNIASWNNLSYPTIGSDGSSGSVIVIENPYIPYKTNDIFSNRTFRAGIRCAADIAYNAFWDCGATAYGFEILNSTLNTGTSSCITIKSNGNIGIGKTNPSVALDVIGNINLSGTITGNGSGLNNLNATNINSGTLAVVNGGTGLSSINTGCILIGNGPNNLVQTNNFIWKDNCLGIGKTNPTTTLDVSGNITASGIITGSGSGLSSLNATNISSGTLSIQNGGTGCSTLNSLFFETTDGVLSIKNKAFNPWEIIGNNLNYINGSIAIGKIIPSSTLDVSGNITASGNIVGNINATNIIYGTLSSTNGGTGCSSINNTFFDTTGGVLSLKTGAASQWINNGNKLYYSTGNVGIGNTNPQFDIDVSGNINFTGSLYKNGSQYISSQWITSSNNSDLYFNTGNVGIGKTNPISNAILDISGNVLVNGNIYATGDIIANSTTNINVPQGGTGNTILVSGQLLIGNGTAALLQTPNLFWDTSNNTLLATNFSGSGANITSLSATNITGNINVSQGGTGKTTLTSGQILIGNGTSALLQTSNLTWDTSNNRFGIGIAEPVVALHVVGEIAATQNITAYYSDERLKTKIANISEPLKIINNLNGFYYVPNELAFKNGIIHTDKEIGLSAQDVQKVLPELINIAPFDLARDKDGNKISKSGENYLTISYERLAPVFVEAIKELQIKIKSQDECIKELETKISKILNYINV
jgi:hypothetical protein